MFSVSVLRTFHFNLGMYIFKVYKDIFFKDYYFDYERSDSESRSIMSDSLQPRRL